MNLQNFVIHNSHIIYSTISVSLSNKVGLIVKHRMYVTYIAIHFILNMVVLSKGRERFTGVLSV